MNRRGTGSYNGILVVRCSAADCATLPEQYIPCVRGLPHFRSSNLVQCRAFVSMMEQSKADHPTAVLPKKLCACSFMMAFFFAGIFTLSRSSCSAISSSSISSSQLSSAQWTTWRLCTCGMLKQNAFRETLMQCRTNTSTMTKRTNLGPTKLYVSPCSAAA